ncbi:SDR family NAD(P)-dependent oxidoreductase [Rhizobium binxianense]
MTPRLALVTGVVGGIGAAIARRLSDNGVKVVTCDRPGERLDGAAARLALPAYGCDLGQPGEAAEMVAKINHDHGAPDILVNAAGGVVGQIGRPLAEVSYDDWRVIFAANVDSAFLLVQAMVPAMKEKGWGRIVTIASGAGLRPSLTGIQAYTAAKHALVGLTKQFSQEFARYGITANSVAPGFVLSNPTTQKQWESYGPEGQQRLVDRIHTRRLGKPEDIAAAAFFASEDAGWTSGQILSVDGGV